MPAIYVFRVLLVTRKAFTAGSTPLISRGAERDATGHERIYAIGDIHGRADLFAALLSAISRDGRSRRPCVTRIVLLGDLIDRGPQSRELLELVRRLEEKFGGLVIVRGNHEEMLVKAAGGSARAQRAWLRNGGNATLLSFGLDKHALVDLDPTERAARICAAIGQRTIDWITALPTQFISGDYYFCHAGVRPGVALGQQSSRDLLWIGEEFLRSKRDHGAVIVHGHSEGARPESLPNRINVDTGAYRTGRLTAVGLEADRRWFLTVGPERT